MADLITEPEMPAPRVFEIEYDNPSYSDDPNPVLKETVSGYLSITPDFVAITNGEGMVTFFIPSSRVVKARCIAVETPSGPAN